MSRILLLESDRQLAKNTADFLASSGHQLLIHADPQQAVAAADSQLPDIVIMNLALAGRSGIEFLHELRSYPDWQQIPIIMLGQVSAEELKSYSNALEQLGLAAYLPSQTTSLTRLLVEIEKLAKPVHK